MNSHYVNWQIPLWSSPRMVTKNYTIPLNGFIDVVQADEQIAQVRYTDKNGIHEGYVELRFVEEYHRHFPFGVVDLSDIETPDSNDLPQYVTWKGVKQVNMCGEICAALWFEVKLSDVLINWEGKKPSFFKRIFGGGKAAGTNADDLVSLFEIYGTEAKKLKITKYTPTLLRNLCEKYFLICSVKMASSGELRNGSILHWVVLDSVSLERKEMGNVVVFNPAANSYESYSWAEWKKAAGIPYGVMIEK